MKELKKYSLPIRHKTMLEKRINLEKGSNLCIPIQLPYKLRNVYTGECLSPERSGLSVNPATIKIIATSARVSDFGTRVDESVYRRFESLSPVKQNIDILQISRIKLITFKTNFVEECECHFDFIHHANDRFVSQSQQSKQNNRT